jgi:hypothetical protein
MVRRRAASEPLSRPGSPAAGMRQPAFQREPEGTDRALAGRKGNKASAERAPPAGTPRLGRDPLAERIPCSASADLGVLHPGSRYTQKTRRKCRMLTFSCSHKKGGRPLLDDRLS